MFTEDNTVFISDTHFGHANIIKYCSRPFASVEEMDAAMITPILEADATGKHIIHLGDVAFSKMSTLPPLQHPENHLMIFGNHDSDENFQYEKWFGIIIGSKKTWREHHYDMQFGRRRVVLSHNPLESFKGDLNIHGHVHNNPYLKPEDERSTFLFSNTRYRNASVELIKYKPITFDELLKVPIPTGFRKEI